MKPKIQKHMALRNPNL